MVINEKKTSYKAISCILLVLVMLLIPSVSAFEFDNVKSYNSVAREVTIKNAYGLGDTIGKARLNTPLNVNVGVGYQKVAEFDLWAYEDYNDALKQFTFKDMKNGKVKINRDYDLKYLTYENVLVDDYKQVCNKDYYKGIQFIEKNYFCEMIKIGSHTEKREVWEKITPADLKKNEVLTVGIFTEVQEGDYVDWIPTIYGVEIEEWASWTDAGLNMAFISYYDFEEASGSVLDSQGSYDLTNTGANPQQTGKINYDYSYDGNDYISGTNIDKDDYNTGLSYNVWVNITETSTIQGVVFVDFEIASYGGAFLMIEDDNDIHFSFGTGVFGGTHPNNDIGFTLNTWHMLTMTHNVTLDCLYMDGVQKVCFASGTMANGGTDFSVGRFNVAQGWYVTGNIDELGIWGDDLTQTQITALHNNGAGLSINETVNLAPTITLNSPTVDANYSSPQTITFNFTAWDTEGLLSDVKLYVNTILNQTNATGINNSDYLFDVYLNDGDWAIYGKATDNVSQETDTATINFVIDSTKPQTFVSGLANLTTLSFPLNSTWSFNASDTHIDKCYYNATGIATTLVTCNSTITSTQWATGGVKNITYCANDTFGNENCTTTSLNVYDFVVSQSGSASAGEGAEVVFGLNVTSTSFAIGDATAVLYWNGTNQGVTSKTVDGNTIRFLETFTIADGQGDTAGLNQSWFWNYNTTQLPIRNTTTQVQTVYAVSITDCAVTAGYEILQLDLEDEETTDAVNVTSPNEALIELDLTITSIFNSSQSWTFSGSWTDDNKVEICVQNNLLNSTSYDIDFVVGYDSTDRVREFYYMDSGTLDNTNYFNAYTIHQIELLDLLSVDSTTFLFEYTDENEQQVDDIIVHTFRKYIGEGLFREAERSQQDSSGQTHIHLVEEDVIYYFMISQYGEILFTSDTYNAKCLSTPCEITLSASATTTNLPDITNDFVVSTNTATRTVTTAFSFENITMVNVSLYSLYNSTSNPILVNSSYLNASSGTINLTAPYSYDGGTFFVSLYKNGYFVRSEWVALVESGIDYFGTMGALLGGLIVLAMMLMAVTEGAGFIIFTCLALIVIGIMQLVDLSWLAIVSICCAGGIILWKLINRRGSRQ